ncbi:hypothetical protein AB1Y20_008904 [Prymnesium parvum]|uniref:Adenylate kinase n=1 Tax=Prymnesium parvum TaxID=97485 RepID=A0AB34K562_PRYPA
MPPSEKQDISFGRKVSYTAPAAANDAGAGEDLTFSWENADAETPYWQQGNEDFETEDMLAMRAALRHDESIKRELRKFWAVYHKDAHGKITKEEYLHVHTKYCLVLIPDISPADARAAGEEDWAGDADGHETMSQKQLFKCLFELADMWCTSVDASEYASFLRKLFKRTTVKHITRPNGEVVSRPPRAPSQSRLREYASFKASRKLQAPAPSTAPVEETEESAAEAPAQAPAGAEGEAAGEAPASASAASAPSATAEDSASEGEDEDDAEVHFSWAGNEHVFPFVLYEEGEIDWKAVEAAAAPVPGAEEEDDEDEDEDEDEEGEVEEKEKAAEKGTIEEDEAPSHPLNQSDPAPVDSAPVDPAPEDAPEDATPNDATPTVDPSSMKSSMKSSSPKPKSTKPKSTPKPKTIKLKPQSIKPTSVKPSATAEGATYTADSVSRTADIEEPFDALATHQVEESGLSKVLHSAAVQLSSSQKKPPVVWVAGPSEATAPLAEDLASSMGAMLITPAKAVEAAARGESDLGVRIASAIKQGSVIDRPTQMEAVLRLLDSPELQVRGAVLVDVDDEAQAFADKVGAPLKTLAVKVGPLELEARREAALAAAAAVEAAAAAAKAAAEEEGEDAMAEPVVDEAEGAAEPPPPPPPPPKLQAAQPAAYLTSDGAVALPGATTIEGALDPPKLLEAALLALEYPTGLSSMPVKISMSEEIAAMPSTADQIEALKQQEELTMSRWGSGCPVNLAKGLLAVGLPTFAAKWNGKLFLCKTEEDLDEFVRAPRSVLSAEPVIPRTAVLAVVGPPLADTKSIASSLAKENELLLISAAALPTMLGGRSTTDSKLCAVALKGAGSAATPAMLAEAIACAAGGSLPAVNNTDPAAGRLVAIMREKAGKPMDEHLSALMADEELKASLREALGHVRVQSLFAALQTVAEKPSSAETTLLQAPAPPASEDAIAPVEGEGAEAPSPEAETAKAEATEPQGGEGTDVQAGEAQGDADAEGAGASMETVEETTDSVLSTLIDALTNIEEEPGSTIGAALASLTFLLSDAEKPTATPATKGVVMDGIPQNSEVCAALESVGMLPQRVLVLEDPNGGEGLQAKLAALIEAGNAPLGAVGPDGTQVELTREGLATLLENFKASFDTARQALEAKGVAVVSVPIENAAEQAPAAMNPFSASASKLAEPVDLSTVPAYGPGSLGNTNDYCPVTLATTGRLLKGKPEFSVKVGDKLYLCAGEEEANLLASLPSKYGCLDKLAQPPPPLFILAGPAGSRKSEQAASLCAARKLPLLDLQALLEANPLEKPPAPPPAAEGEEAAGVGEGELEDLPDPVRTPAMVAELLAKTLQAEPYLSDGVVVDWPEGLPLDRAHAEALLAAKLVPDAVIHFQLSDEGAVARLFSPAKVPTLKDAEKVLRAEGARELLASKVEEEEDEEGPLHTLMSSEDEAQIAKQAALLEAEVSLDSDEVQEKLEAMREEAQGLDEEQKAKLAEANAARAEEIATGLEALASVSVPTLVLDAMTKPKQLERLMLAAVEPWTKLRSSIFAKALALDAPTADAQLVGAQAMLSKFAYHDPVMLLDQGLLSAPLVPALAPPVPEPPPAEEEENEPSPDDDEESAPPPPPPPIDGVFPARLRDQIYVFQTLANREAFLKDPMRYALAAPPPPHIVPRAAVVGEPASSVAQLAAILSERVGAVEVSIASATEWVLQSGCALDSSLRSALDAGLELKTEHALRVLQLRLGAPDALAKGWVLTAAPADSALADALGRSALMPHRVYHVAAPDAPPAEPLRSVLKSYAARGIVVPIDSGANVWAQHEQAATDLRDNLLLRRRHAAAIAERKAAAVGELGLTVKEFEDKLGKFGRYCPVTWTRERRLVHCGEDAPDDPRAPIKYAAEFRGCYYSLAGLSQLVAFLVRPTEVLHNSALPETLPRSFASPADINISNAPELAGYCPVSLGRGPSGADFESRMASLKGGLRDFAVEYAGKLFLMSGRAEKSEFLSRPWAYSQLELPVKLPPKAVQMALNSLPTQGYVEQAVGDTLTAALTELCMLKPKYPTLDARESAVKFLALYLKAHNPNVRAPHIKHRHGGKLHEFTECCSLVDALLSLQSTKAEGDVDAAGENMTSKVEQLDERARLVALWDGLKERKIEDFMPKPVAPSL